MMVNEKETSELTYESQLDEGFLNPNSTIDTYNKIKLTINCENILA